MKKILIFGGSFNPIHNGHTEIVKRAAQEIGADKIILIPTGRSEYKKTDFAASRDDRLNMCILATENENIEVSTIELYKNEQSYTCETLDMISKKYKNAKLYFLMGSDSFMQINTWKKPEEILSLASIIIVPRNSDTKDEILEYQNKNYPDSEIIILDYKKIDVSSSDIRSKLKNNHEVKGVNAKVFDYIKERGLYI